VRVVSNTDASPDGVGRAHGALPRVASCRRWPGAGGASSEARFPSTRRRRPSGPFSWRRRPARAMALPGFAQWAVSAAACTVLVALVPEAVDARAGGNLASASRIPKLLAAAGACGTWRVVRGGVVPVRQGRDSRVTEVVDARPCSSMYARATLSRRTAASSRSAAG